LATVLITSEFFGKFDDTARKMLIDAGHTVIDNPYGHKFLSPEEIIPHARDADAFICDLEKITKEVIDAAPNLKIISRRGVGIDNVDCRYAESRGIEVSRTLGIVEAPVSELIMSYILNFSRNVDQMNIMMHQGIWKKLMSFSVEGKTLGIAGMGNIGTQLAKRAVAFGMKILYCSRSENKSAETEYGAKRVSFDELLSESDFISVNMALTEETRGLFDYAAFCKMKPGAYFINTARGAIIKEQDLKKALEEKRISGAAIDVFDVEPQTESIFRGMDNVILTPHIGSFTREVFIEMDIAAAENVIRRFRQS
jgi:phosphoglycerate dehydrogenase-like enzyme